LRILNQLQDQADTVSEVSSGKYILCVQGEPGGNVNILGGDSVGHWEKRTSYEHVPNSEWSESSDLIQVIVCSAAWISEVNKIKVDTPDELLARILDAAGCIKESEDQLRRRPRDIRTWVAKCTEVGGGILERLLWTVTDLWFVCNKFVI